jgi:cobalt-zinc-cadmium efflux system membrane fusion protein
MVALLLLWSISVATAQDDHEGHDHATEQAVEEDHAGHDHGAEEQPAAVVDDHANCDGNHGDEEEAEGLIVELSPEAVMIAGITIEGVKQGAIGKILELPGEVSFNEDRLAHIAPRFPGIAIKANHRVGEYVNTGDVVAVVESNESMNVYSITAPISGWIIDRHITVGEFVSQENSIYVIADLSTVWVNLAVYPADADLVKKGQVAQIEAIATDNVTTGVIEYVTPIVDPRTRSLSARVALSNPDHSWRPGTFVRASVATAPEGEGLVVEKNAVQNLDNKSVVFVVAGPNKFRPVEVVTGSSDHEYIQIMSGLTEGTQYVSNGAFEVKAKIVTSNLDAHAGHGH